MQTILYLTMWVEIEIMQIVGCTTVLSESVEADSSSAQYHSFNSIYQHHLASSDLRKT